MIPLGDGVTHGSEALTAGWLSASWKTADPFPARFAPTLKEAVDFAEQLKSSIDIVKVAGEYVRLKRVGATGRYLGLCPFHQEKTPSFNVNQPRQFYKCFGCGVGGDVFKFVMQIEGLTFSEALTQLSEHNGIPMPKRSDYSDSETRLRNALHEMHALAADVFRDNLRGPHGADTRAYLVKRAVPQEMIDTFGLGCPMTPGKPWFGDSRRRASRRNRWRRPVWCAAVRTAPGCTTHFAGG